MKGILKHLLESAAAKLSRRDLFGMSALAAMAPGAAPVGSVWSQHTYHVIHTTKE